VLNYFFEHWEIISGIVTFIFGLVQFLYCKSEKFFLFINKTILNFKKHKIPVYIFTKISLTSKMKLDDIKKIIREINFNNKEYIPIEIKVNTSPYNETKLSIFIKNRSFLSKIDDDKEIIREKINEILERTKSTLTNVDIDINFEKNKNPYEGLFVKKLPIEKIKNFSVKIELNNSLVEAKKDKIKISGKNLNKVLFVLDKIVNLKLPVFSR